jgi:hypothetical protein
VHRHDDRRLVPALDNAAAHGADARARTQDRARGSGAEAHDQLRIERGHFALKP